MRFDNRQNLLLLLAGLSVVVLLGDRIVVSPLLGLWSARSAEIAELEKDLSSGTQLLKREEVFESRWADMQAQSLPTDKAEAESRIARAVQRWAQASRLNLSTQNMRWVEDETEYLKLEFQTAGEGDISSIARFLYEMESDATVAVRFQDLTLDTRDESGQKLSMSVKFTGLALKGAES